MEPIRDCKNNLICYVNPENGYVESKYKKQIMKVKIELGNSITIIRDQTETIVRRTEKGFETISK